jgi:hypothetical protein
MKEKSTKAPKSPSTIDVNDILEKKEVFKTFGNAINQDLSTFHIDLSVTKTAANSDMRSTLAIFEQMYAKQQEINRK